MNNAAFFASARKTFGPLSQGQVDGMLTLLVATAGLPRMHRAYILATAWHETAFTMQPIAEYGKGKGKPYGRIDSSGKAPYGRGFVQLTHRDNYVKLDKRLGLGGKLAADYDLAINPDIAAKIIVIGMAEGLFTGKKLSDYKTYVGMRAVVNGTDRAKDIATYALQFEDALAAAEAPNLAPQPVPPPAPVVVAPKPETPPAASVPQPRGLLRAILDLIALIFQPKKG